MERSERRRARLGRGRRSLLRKLNSRSRAREERVLVEGPRAVREVLRSEAEVEFGVVEEGFLDSAPAGELARALLARGVEILEEPRGAFREIAATDSPRGVLLVCREPRAELTALTRDRSRGLLVLDAVQDPGNVGTLIRTGWALGIGGAVALEGTADPWNPKSVRASAGGSFHLPVARCSVDELLDWVCAEDVRLLGAVPGAPAPRGPAPEAWALAVGSEGSGVRQSVLEAADVRVGLPMPGGAESLNAAVAGSILLYLLCAGRAEEGPYGTASEGVGQ